MPFLDPTEEAISKVPLPRNWIRDPRLIAVWISSVVPCVRTGVKQSISVWNVINRYLRSSGVSDSDIARAIDLSGEQFEKPLKAQTPDFTPLTNFLNGPGGKGIPSHLPTSYQADFPDDSDALLNQAAAINSKYLAARAAHNIHGMEIAAQMLVDMLKLVAQWKKTRSDAEAEAQKIQAAILINASAARNAIRMTGSRDGPAPGPNGARVRQTGPNTFVYEIDEDALKFDELQGESESDAEREAD
jgi:hypothetical protein